MRDRRGAYLPLSPEALVDHVSEYLARSPDTVRVAIDGAPCAQPHRLAMALVQPLQTMGRRVAHVRAEYFWRDASVRLEHGRQDPDSYLDWLDTRALRREVLDRVTASGSYLPSLRDPATNRATRAEPRDAPPGAVVVLSGPVLLGLGLPFDVVIHLDVSPAALVRRTAPDQAWTVPAFERYRAEVDPLGRADIVVRMDDPERPAVGAER